MRPVALSLLLASPAFAAPTLEPDGRLSGLVLGTETVALKPGDDPAPLAGRLGIEHGEHGAKVTRWDFTSGPLTVEAGAKGGVTGVHLKVKEAGGLNVGTEVLAQDASLADAAKLQGCAAVTAELVFCREGQLWFTAPGGGLELHLGTASLESLGGRWKGRRLAHGEGHGTPRGDLKPGAPGSVAKDALRLGDSRCTPKTESVRALVTATWLEDYKASAAETGFDVPVVFEVGTGCTDILGRLYAVGDELVVTRNGNFFIFGRP